VFNIYKTFTFILTLFLKTITVAYMKEQLTALILSCFVVGSAGKRPSLPVAVLKNK